VADYFRKESIGKAHIIGYLGFVFGEVLAVGVLFRVTDHMHAQDAFFLVGIFTIVLTSSLLCMISEPKIRTSKYEQPGQDHEIDDSASISDVNSVSSPISLKGKEYRTFNDYGDEEADSQKSNKENTQLEDVNKLNRSSIVIEEEFDELTLYQKVKIMTEQVVEVSKEDIAFPICFLAALICKTAFILFSVFMLLWVTSFIESG